MRIPILTFGAIASVLTINSAFATSSTVTSRDYVDTQDALKQNKIPAAGTNASTPGETVVTYTTTGNGVIGERGIYDGTQAYNRFDNNKLVTVDVIRRNNTCIQSAMPGFDCEEEDLNGNCLLVHLYEPTYVCDNPFDPNQRCLTEADCTCPSSSSPVCDNGYCGCFK